MTTMWAPDAPGVMRLPSGRLLRGRGLSQGMPAGPGLAYVRGHYSARAVETPWQRRYVARFRPTT